MAENKVLPWQLQNQSLEIGDYDLMTEVRNKLERMGHEQEKDSDFRSKIPKIFRKYLPKKNGEMYKKTKKVQSKNNSFQDTLLNFEEQIKINMNILKLQNILGVKIEQKNGQRILRAPPPDGSGPPPGPTSEVFVGRIPTNIYEDVIYPLFRQVGNIYEMRLMMNFSGRNRGYCFIMYKTPEIANKAIEKLNNYEIFPGWNIGVVKSINNCRLHITNLPSTTEARILMEKISPVCENIDYISVLSNPKHGQTKQAIISFKNHRSAAMARRRLLPERNHFFNKTAVRIEWAHPKAIIMDVIEDKAVCGNNGEILFTRTVRGDAENNTSKTGYGCVVKKRSVQNTSNTHNSGIVNYTNNYENNSVNNSVQEENLNDCLLQLNTKNPQQNDDYKTGRLCPYNSEPVCNSISFLNPKNCSVVQYPWKFIYTLEQSINTQHKNRNFYNIAFPWKTMNSDTFNNIQMPTLPNNGVLNYVPQFIQNNFNTENIELYHDNRNVRPILNRNLSCI